MRNTDCEAVVVAAVVRGWEVSTAQLTLPHCEFRSGARKSSRVWQELIVDNFAGGGGASLGIERGAGRAVDISINHDASAVEMHRLNHPATRHFCEDVWEVNPLKVTRGRPVGIAWFSPDCKHFSRAKGGKPVEKRIRGLAWIVIRWAKIVKPRIIFLENVREFEDWGPLAADNRPCPIRKGTTFKRWKSCLKSCGYVVETKVLNAADYGAPTHRRRLFLIARRDGEPIVWPKATHGPGTRRKYRTAAECIDWNLPCHSIFLTREEGRAVGVNRPLADKTMRRIAMGLKRYVIDNPKPFIVNVQHGGDHFRGQPADIPLSTISAKHGYGLVTPFVAGVGGRAGQSPATGGDAPIGTVTAKNDRAIVAPILVSRYGEGPGQQTRGQNVGEPIRTVTPANNTGVLIAPHLVEVQNGSSIGHRSIDRPSHTITANPKGGGMAMAAPILVGVGGPGYSAKPADADQPIGTVMTENHRALAAAFIAKHYGGVVGHEVTRPIGTVTAVDHHSVAASTLIHMNHGAKTASGVDEPMRTVTAGGLHAAEVRAFLIKYFGCGCGQKCSEPMHTVTSRDRFGLVTVEGQDYQIVDIGLRMLTPRELARAQGFPDSYILTGTKSSQVAKIGNSVCPVMAEALVRANYGEVSA